MRPARPFFLRIGLTLSIVASCVLSPIVRSSQAEESQAPALDREDGRRRSEWDLEWYGSEWSQAYRQQLYRIGVLQRIVHANKLQLPQSMLKGTFLPAAAPGNAWVNLGPEEGGVDYEVSEGGFLFKRTLAAASDSGRPNQLVPHPLDSDTLFVVSAEGGLWRRSKINNRFTWTPLTDNEPSLALGALAIDPVTPSIMYLGLGDVEEASFGGTGTGVLKSVDNGQTWGKPVLLGKSRSVTSILVHPTETSLILTGTNDGLFRSLDSGAHYSKVSLPAGSPKTVRDINWIRGSHIVLAAGNNFDFGNGPGGANILFSDDNGASWESARGLGNRAMIRRFSLAASPKSDVLYALASDTRGELFEIFKSTNGGVDWLPTNARSISYTNPLPDRNGLASLLGGQGGYNQLAIVDPRHPNVAVFGGDLNLVKTSDGGATYTIISDWLGEHHLPYVHADFHCAAFDGGQNLWVGNDGGLARSTDGGTTWSTAENQGLPTHLAYSISSNPISRDVVIIGLQDNGTRVRTGNTAKFSQRIFADGFGALAHPLDSSLLLGSAYYTRILKSHDGGKTFQGSYSEIGEAGKNREAPFYTRIVPWTGDSTGNTVYTFVNSKIYKSTNFGDSWSPLEVIGLSGAIRNFGVANSDGLTLGLISTGGAVYLSTDGGQSWNIASGMLPGNSGRLSYISFSPVDPKTVYVASVAPSTTATHLWKSTDGGGHWEAIDTAANFPHGVPVNVVVGDPGDADTLYAGTHLGLYKSSDGGENWTRFGFGLPLVSVTDIYVAPDSSLLRIATYGRGVWELTP